MKVTLDRKFYALPLIKCAVRPNAKPIGTSPGSGVVSIMARAAIPFARCRAPVLHMVGRNSLLFGKLPQGVRVIELTGCDFIVGDSAQILTELPESIIDLTVTSPSYDGLRDYKGYVFDFEAIATELYRVIKPGGVVVWVVADATVDASETGTSFRQALYFKACGFNLHDTMLYKKKGTGACGSNNAYWQTFEFMFIFSKGNPKTFNPIQDIQNARVGTQSGKRRYPNGSARPGLGNPSPRMSRRTNIWEYATGNATSDDAATHPAVFPESLAADHIKSWSNVGDLVLDPFSGSGTTGKMAYKFGRRFLGIEISPDYVALAQQRLGKEQNQPALFASSEIG